MPAGYVTKPPNFRPHYRVEAWIRTTDEDQEGELEDKIQALLFEAGLSVEGIVVFRTYNHSEYVT